MLKFALISDTHSKYPNPIQSNISVYYKINDLTPKVDAVLHCGDWIMSDRQNNLSDAMKTLRECIDDDIPIFTVFGNHDYWNGESNSFISYNELEEFFQKCCSDNGIIRVTPDGHFFKNLYITGFDGWYGDSNPPTKDKQKIELEIDDQPAHNFLMKKAHKDVEKILLYTTKTPCIIMTHFQPFVEDNNSLHIKLSANLKYFDPLIKETNCKALCAGHTHRQYIGLKNNVLILNPGGDYGNPNFLTFNIEV